MVHFDTNFLIQTVVVGSAAHVRFRGWMLATANTADFQPFLAHGLILA